MNLTFTVTYYFHRTMACMVLLHHKESHNRMNLLVPVLVAIDITSFLFVQY